MSPPGVISFGLGCAFMKLLMFVALPKKEKKKKNLKTKSLHSFVVFYVCLYSFLCAHRCGNLILTGSLMHPIWFPLSSSYFAVMPLINIKRSLAVRIPMWFTPLANHIKFFVNNYSRDCHKSFKKSCLTWDNLHLRLGNAMQPHPHPAENGSVPGMQSMRNAIVNHLPL